MASYAGRHIRMSADGTKRSGFPSVLLGLGGTTPETRGTVKLPLRKRVVMRSRPDRTNYCEPTERFQRPAVATATAAAAAAAAAVASVGARPSIGSRAYGETRRRRGAGEGGPNGNNCGRQRAIGRVVPAGGPQKWVASWVAGRLVQATRRFQRGSIYTQVDVRTFI